MAKIAQIHARQILNAKGNPTVEVQVVLDNGLWATASCPTGTSVSKYEAKEIRDNDPQKFNGLGVLNAISNVNTLIAPALIGQEAGNQSQIDKSMIELDGTQDKSKLGVNAILPVSMAVAKVSAKALGIPTYAYIRKYTSLAPLFKIPTPAFNIINGGKHAGGNLDFQEFLIIPATSIPYTDALNMATIIYQSLKKTLNDKGATTLIGDEGGFGPSFATNRDALVMLTEAIGNSNYRINYDVFLGLDAAADSFFENGKYQIKDKTATLSSKEMVSVYESLNDEFNLLYLEDPVSEDDWEGWTSLNNITAKNTLVIGDDLTSTNLFRLQMALNKKAIGGMIIKPNQIGTVIETLAVVEVARNSGLKIIVSHRSGDTDDDFIADFAVGVNADYVKFGAPARGERVAKYNRLLEINDQIKAA